MKVRDDIRTKAWWTRRAFSIVVPITPSQVKMAEKLGVPLKEYIKCVTKAQKNPLYRYRRWGQKHWTWTCSK